MAHRDKLQIIRDILVNANGVSVRDIIYSAGLTWSGFQRYCDILIKAGALVKSKGENRKRLFTRTFHGTNIANQITSILEELGMNE